MRIPPVAAAHPQQPVRANSAPGAARSAQAAQQARIAPSQVSAAVLQRATGDGDGRTGAAALNDGDAAALAAARSAGHGVDVKV
jgi:hypothetical protein